VKRALIAVAGTVASVAWLITYRVTPAHVQAAGADAAAPSPEAVAAPTPGPSAPVAAAPTSTPNGSDGTYTGAAEPNFYGTVQVKVTIKGGRISDVQAIQLPNDRSRSAYISQVAGPMLRSEVLQAQNAQIDVISGATYTSEGYAQSVASALSKAHFAH
jgi:uncharacterized protein with FMN-binding domain